MATLAWQRVVGDGEEMSRLCCPGMKVSGLCTRMLLLLKPGKMARNDRFQQQAVGVSVDICVKTRDRKIENEMLHVGRA